MRFCRLGRLEPRRPQHLCANVHLDREIGWLYPLVELNWAYHTSSVDVDSVTRHGFIDFGTFANTGNIVMLAVGANAVLRPGLEIGAVYSTASAASTSTRCL